VFALRSTPGEGEWKTIAEGGTEKAAISTLKVGGNSKNVNLKKTKSLKMFER